MSAEQRFPGARIPVPLPQVTAVGLIKAGEAGHPPGVPTSTNTSSRPHLLWFAVAAGAAGASVTAASSAAAATPTSIETGPSLDDINIGPINPDTIVLDNQCPDGLAPYIGGKFCCAGTVSSAGDSCSGSACAVDPADRRGFPPCVEAASPRCDDETPGHDDYYGGWNGGFCCDGNVTHNGARCDGSVCSVAGNAPGINACTGPSCPGSLTRYGLDQGGFCCQGEADDGNCKSGVLCALDATRTQGYNLCYDTSGSKAKQCRDFGYDDYYGGYVDGGYCCDGTLGSDLDTCTGEFCSLTPKWGVPTCAQTRGAPECTPTESQWKHRWRVCYFTGPNQTGPSHCELRNGSDGLTGGKSPLMNVAPPHGLADRIQSVSVEDCGRPGVDPSWLKLLATSGSGDTSVIVGHGNIDPRVWRDIDSIVVTHEGEAHLCLHAESRQTGRQTCFSSLTVGEGVHNLHGAFNDGVRSVSAKPSWLGNELWLYEHWDNAGLFIGPIASDERLAARGWEDKASSFSFRGVGDKTRQTFAMKP